MEVMRQLVELWAGDAVADVSEAWADLTFRHSDPLLLVDAIMLLGERDPALEVDDDTRERMYEIARKLRRTTCRG